MTEWCWYNEGGGSFHDGFASRAEATIDALDNAYHDAMVGTVSDAFDHVMRAIDAHDIASHASEEACVDDFHVTARTGAQAALEAWARKWLELDMERVCVDAMRLDIRFIPTEFCAGEWILSGEAEPDAVVTYASEPSPETGHVGWCWWAQGRMGAAPTYADAKRCAEDALRAHRTTGVEAQHGS